MAGAPPFHADDDAYHGDGENDDVRLYDRALPSVALAALAAM